MQKLEIILGLVLGLLRLKAENKPLLAFFIFLSTISNTSLGVKTFKHSASKNFFA